MSHALTDALLPLAPCVLVWAEPPSLHAPPGANHKQSRQNQRRLVFLRSELCGRAPSCRQPWWCACVVACAWCAHQALGAKLEQAQERVKSLEAKMKREVGKAKREAAKAKAAKAPAKPGV